MQVALTPRKHQILLDLKIYRRYLKGNRRITQEIVDLVNQEYTKTHQELYRLKKKLDAKEAKEPGRQPHFTYEEFLGLQEFILDNKPKIVQRFLKSQLLLKNPHLDVTKCISLKYVYQLKNKLKEDEDMPITERDNNNNPNDSQTDVLSNNYQANQGTFYSTRQLEIENLSSGMRDEGFSPSENLSCSHPFQDQCSDSESLFREQPFSSEQRQNQNNFPNFSSNYQDNPEEKRIETGDPYICGSSIEHPNYLSPSIEIPCENPGQRRMSDAIGLNQSEEDKPPILDEQTNQEGCNQLEIDYLTTFNE